MNKRNDNDTLSLEVAMDLFDLGITFEINDGHVVRLLLDTEEV